jgi:hypothetical protein
MSDVFLMPAKPEVFPGPPFFTGTIFFEVGERFGTVPNDFIRVQLPHSSVEGWLKVSSGIIVPDPARPTLDEEGFVRSALIAEDAFNALPETAPNFVFADYVLALAVVESGMTNLGAIPPSDAIGPLQITVAKWQDFQTNGKPLSDIFSNRDRPSAQVYCASFRMRADGKAIAAAQPAGSPPPKITLLDLFHAYLTNSPPSALPIRDAAADPANAAKAPEQVNAALTKDVVIDVFGKLQKLVLGSTFPANFGQFVKLTETALDAALQKAAALIQTHAPDQVPPTPQANADDPVGPRPGQGASPASGLNYAAAGGVQPRTARLAIRSSNASPMPSLGRINRLRQSQTRSANRISTRMPNPRRPSAALGFSNATRAAVWGVASHKLNCVIRKPISRLSSRKRSATMNSLMRRRYMPPSTHLYGLLSVPPIRAERSQNGLT